MEIRMIVPRRPNMFTVCDHPLQFMGMGVIMSVFTQSYADRAQIDTPLVAYYPERFLNVQQQQDLIPLLERMGCPLFSVVTGSPLLIQNTHHYYIRIPCGDEDDPIGHSVMCDRDYMNVDFDALFSEGD